MKKNKNIRKIFKYFKNLKLPLFFLLLIMILLNGINVLNPIINAKLLTSLTEFDANKAIKLAIISFLLIILKTIFTLIHNYIYFSKIKNQLMYNIRKDMINNIFKMKTLNFDKHSSGEFAERLKHDPESISQILSIIEYNFLTLITDFIIVIYVLRLNLVIGIIYLISIFVIYFYDKLEFISFEKLSKEKRNLEDKNSSIINEIIRGIRDIKLLNLTKQVSKIVNDGLDETFKTTAKRDIKMGYQYDVIRIIQGLFTLIVIVLGIIFIKNKMLTITNMLIIYMYRTEVFNIGFSITSIKDNFTNIKVASDRIFEFMDENSYPKEKYGDIELKNIKGKIEFKNLSFSYQENKPVLKDINFKINPNENIGLVGISGSGKTTLVNLLCKSYDVDDNMIFIDDVDLNKLTESSIRDNISIISQNPYIFNMSIKDNLKLVGDKITNKEVIEACKIAEIDDFINSLPEKYDTMLGEGGLTLSGGQRQRLAIARALLNKGKIIIFDEATSALDNITQAKIQKSINEIKNDYTMIIIAHRLSTIVDCDKILFLKDGKINSFGTHKELMKNNKEYNKLYSSESKNNILKEK